MVDVGLDCCNRSMHLLIGVLFVESFTADHKPLLGESPDVRGYFLGCGFNSGGMLFSEY